MPLADKRYFATFTSHKNYAMKKYFRYKYLFTFSLLLLIQSLSAKTVEIPFIHLPTGQVLIEIDLMGKAGKQFFVVETAGKNLVRNDMTQRLDFLGIDTTESFLEFPEIRIKDMVFTNKNNFRLKKALGKRSEYAFPPSALGTLGPKFFRKKVLQFDFQKHTLRISDAVEELELKEKTPFIYFTQSFTHAVPVVDAHGTETGDGELYLSISQPVSLNFPQKNMTSLVQKSSSSNQSTFKMSLDGERKIVFTSYITPTLYLNRRLTLTNINVTFTDDLMPCIGNAFLKNFITTMDFNNGVLYLDPATEEADKLLINNTDDSIK